MSPYYIIAVSIILQLAATVQALRLIRITRRITAWIIIALAISLMAARRASTLAVWISQGLHSFPAGVLTTEVIALVSSSLMVVGLTLIAPLFRALKRYTEESITESERKYQMLAGNIPAVVFKGYADGTVDFFDDKVAEVSGYPKEVFNRRQKNWLDIVLPDDIRESQRVFVQALKAHSPYMREYRIRQKNGGFVWLQERGQIVCDAQGRIDYISGVFFDISERKETEEALSRSREELSTSVEKLEKRNQELILLGEMGDMLQSCVNMEETYNVAANFLKEIFREESGALFMLDTSCNLLKAVSTWGELTTEGEIFPREECWALRTGKILGADAHHIGLCRHPNAPREADNLCIPMMAQGEALGILRIQRNNPDGNLQESKKQLAATVAEHLALALANLNLRETLRHQSVRDPLTGLFNRRFMDEVLQREIYRANRYQRPLGLVLLDIDHFKRLNDSFGHEAGDTLLREMGTFLQSKIREGDTACRYGGEEFLIIMPDMALPNLVARAEQLRERFNRLTFLHQGQSLGMVTFSLGLAALPEHGASARALLQAADKALYRAKSEGRNRVALPPAEAEERLVSPVCEKA